MNIRQNGRRSSTDHRRRHAAARDGCTSRGTDLGRRFHGGRDQHFGLRIAYEEVNFWLWLDIGFEDRAIEAWVVESPTARCSMSTVASLRRRHAVDAVRRLSSTTSTFDGDRKRPGPADVVFTDEDGRTYRVTGQLTRIPTSTSTTARASRGAEHGEQVVFSAWNSSDLADLGEVESGPALSIDQLMRYEMDGMVGSGIYVAFVHGDHYQRYPTWG